MLVLVQANGMCHLLVAKLWDCIDKLCYYIYTCIYIFMFVFSYMLFIVFTLVCKVVIVRLIRSDYLVLRSDCYLMLGNQWTLPCLIASYFLSQNKSRLYCIPGGVVGFYFGVGVNVGM